jgi:Arc/MetJ family transcription regulator
MPQVNIRVTEDFARDLARYMKARGIPTKSAALRTAVRDGLERSRATSRVDVRSWLGLARRGRENPRRRFRSEDDLWR